MRLTHLNAQRYLSLRDASVDFGDLNLFIGANAAGKSNILDALNFLSQGLEFGDFSRPVAARGGIIHLAWKGEEADLVQLTTTFRDGERTFSWHVSLAREQFSFRINEEVQELREGSDPPQLLLRAQGGQGWWWSGEAKKQIPLDLRPTACALTQAAGDASFSARSVAQFVGGWGFFDPSASNLRRASSATEVERLDATGGNLAGRLHALKETGAPAYAKITAAVRSVLGVPDELLFRVSDENGRVYFVQRESGLQYTVHQVGVSSGTLRMLALMTALFDESGSGLVGIEEPENHIHPAAVASFAEHLKVASDRVQVLVTTHSPLLLDAIDAPEAVCVVRRTQEGTAIEKEADPTAVREALQASGFGLGEYHETKGFGY